MPQNVDRAAAVEAQAALIEKVYKPVFFAKLAEYGIVPQTAAEADELLAIGGKLEALAESSAQQHAQQHSQKQAGLIHAANARLDEVLGLQPSGYPDAAFDAACKQAAASHVADPEVAAAAAVLGRYVGR